MKEKHVLGMFLIVCILLSGCSQREVTVQNKNPNIHILYDIDEVPRPEKVVVYTAAPFCADEEYFCDYLLRDEIVKEEVDAFGRVYRTDSEALYFYQIEQDAGFYGGLSYYGQKSYNNDIIPVTKEHPTNVEQILGHLARADFAHWKDLEFQSVEEVLRNIDDVIMTKMPEVEVSDVYSLDADTIVKHAAVSEANEEPGERTEWGKEDEAYLIFYEQTVDGIPLSTHVGSYTNVSIIYAQDGIRDFEAHRIVNDLQEVGTYSILSPKEAENAMIEEYQEVAQVTEFEVEEMELNYVVLKKEEKGELILVPVYIFCIAKESPWSYEDDNELFYKDYEHYAIDAINGQRIVGSAYEYYTFDFD